MSESNTEQTTGKKIDLSADNAQMVLNAQIAYAMSELAQATHVLEMDGIQHSALNSALLGSFVQHLTAMTVLNNHSREELQATLKTAFEVMSAYADEVFTGMTATAEEVGA